MRAICTIGFAKKSLRQFIQLLKNANVTKIVDIRLNNTSQLAGFAKKDDLKYVLELVGIGYIHFEDLAPDDQLLEDYKKKRVKWSDYEKRYLDLLLNRKIDQKIDKILGEGLPCFLCSEHEPKFCHRRLLAEYISNHYNDQIVIKHLL